MPRYIIGAVSMKISSSTSTTSTNGMILISASEPPIRRPSPPPESRLNAIFASVLQHGARDQVEEIHREPLHLRGPVLHSVDEVVVGDDGGDGGGEAEGGGDEGFRDARRHHREVRGAL